MLLESKMIFCKVVIRKVLWIENIDKGRLFIVRVIEYFFLLRIAVRVGDILYTIGLLFLKSLEYSREREKVNIVF